MLAGSRQLHLSFSGKFYGSCGRDREPSRPRGCVWCWERMRGEGGGPRAVGWAGVSQGSLFTSQGPACGLLSSPGEQWAPLRHRTFPLWTPPRGGPWAVKGADAREPLALMSQPGGRAPQPGLSPEGLRSSQRTHPLDHLKLKLLFCRLAPSPNPKPQLFLPACTPPAPWDLKGPL